MKRFFQFILIGLFLSNILYATTLSNGSYKKYSFTKQENRDYTISIDVTAGDCDLYSHYETNPTTTHYQLKSERRGNLLDEKIQFFSSKASSYYFSIYGKNSCSFTYALTSSTNQVNSVLSPVRGDFTLASSSSSKWAFNQHKSGLHSGGSGIGDADDTYAWDINLNTPSFDSDNGKPVYAVEDGVVASSYGDKLNVNGSYGQVLIEHTANTKWWSGYLHLKNIQVSIGSRVTKDTLIGYISNSGTSANHLHFVTYKGANSLGKLKSFNVNFLKRDSVTDPSANKIVGIDVSDNNGVIDWSSVDSKFAFVKATEGYADASFPESKAYDNQFISNMDGAIANDILVGAYHFARPEFNVGTAEAKKEANYFVSKIKSYYQDYRLLPPVIDIETSSGYSKSTLTDWLLAFAEEVEAKLGVKPMFYMNEDYVKNRVDSSRLSSYKLWEAKYSSTAPTTGSWSRYTYWQYSSSGSQSGINGNVDKNIFNGTLTELSAQLVSSSESGNDFYISNERIDKTSFSAGEYIRVDCNQYYSGQESSLRPSVGYFISTNSTWDSSDVLLGEDLSSLSSTDVEDDEGGTFTIPGNLSSGSYYLLFVADYKKEYSESNENNNIKYKTFNIQSTGTGGNDFYILNQTVDKSSVIVGESIELRSNQYYSGSSENTLRPTLEYYLSKDNVWDSSDLFLADDYSTLSATDLEDGEYVRIAIPANTTVGQYYVLFKSDAKNEYAETNENNNIAYVPLRVETPSDDFYLKDEALDKSTVTVGEIVVATVGQSYKGNAYNELSVELGYFLSKDSVWDSSDILLEYDVSSLGKTDLMNVETESLQIPTNTAIGTYYILFVTDYKKEHSEADENNNIKYKKITVEAKVLLPNITAITPNSVVQSTKDISVTLTGGNYTATSEIFFSFNGRNSKVDASNIVFVDASRLNFTIRAGVVGDWLFEVRNGVKVSNKIGFTVTKPEVPTPIVARITPDTLEKSSKLVEIIVEGSEFLSTSKISLNGVDVENIDYLDSEHLKFLFKAEEVGQLELHVKNGDKISNLLELTVTEPKKILKSIMLKAPWTLVGINSTMTLERLQSKIDKTNLLVVQGQVKTYQKAYEDRGEGFLNDWSSFEGAVWVKVAHDVNLTYEEEVYSDKKEIVIIGGAWRLVNPLSEMSLEAIKNQLGADNIDVIQGQVKTYQKAYEDKGEGFLNDLNGFSEPKGYWIKLFNDAVLTFDFSE